MDVGDILVEFRRTGGRAGNDEHLVVGRDGQAMLRTPDGTQRLELGPATVEQLGQQLAAAGFTELPEDLRSRRRRTNPSLMSSSTPLPPKAIPSGRSAVRSRRSWCPWSRR
jgi:hypothetical protein